MTAQLSLFPERPRPLAGCVTPEAHAWRAFQSKVRRRLTEAYLAGRCREVGALRRDLKATVHAALRGRS